MYCPNKILPSDTPVQHHKKPKTATPIQALDTTKKIETEEIGPDHSLGIAYIAAPSGMTCTEAAPDHNKGMGTATIEGPQGNPIQHTETTEPTMTHHTGHTADHPHTTAHQVTTTKDHGRSC